MRVQKRSPWLNGLGAVLTAMALWGAQAQADVSSDKPGSVVMWPKVIADGTRDTLISLTNTTNLEVYAHCEYVQALGICAITDDLFCDPEAVVPGSPGICPPLPGNSCTPQWQAADFDVVLTRQQPTFWRVSTGRRANPFLLNDGECQLVGNAPPIQECPGLFLVGLVPPAPDQPFRGELRCIQVDMDGGALPSDALKGEATIETLPTMDILAATQISMYNSINIQGDTPSSVDGLIELNDINYNACPEAVEVSHYAQGAQNLVAENIDPTVCATSGCPVETQLTVVPCRANFPLHGTRVALDIQYTNEFEQTLSIEQPFDCWLNVDLRDLAFAPFSIAGSEFQRTRLIPTGSGVCISGGTSLSGLQYGPCREDDDCGVGGVCAPVSGVLAVVEEFHYVDAALTDPPTAFPGTAASNAYSVDVDGDGDLGRPGHCRGDLTQECDDNAVCGTGFCRINSTVMCSNNTTCTNLDLADFCDLCMNDEIQFVPAEVNKQ